ncbi:MAG: hypothetical protein WBF20_20595, partial [Trebonia sp.]|uniref:hypothetical protein n=1 Tax=Trebonia sp. TaxID=2767075 RepID=UPI003C77F927
QWTLVQIEDETRPARATQPSLSVGVGEPAVSQRELALPERPQADHVSIVTAPVYISSTAM